MVGDYDQMHPIFSAKKSKRKTCLCLCTRAGEEVTTTTPKLINISKFEVTKVDGLNIDFIINCSKGTYIRLYCSRFWSID